MMRAGRRSGVISSLTAGGNGRDGNIADLIVIGFPDEAAGAQAAEQARRLAKDRIIEPDAIATVVRDKEGGFQVTTSHHEVGEGTAWGTYWGFLFDVIFFVPVLGMAAGARLGAIMQKVERSGVDKAFQDQARDMLQPGTSALFFLVEKSTPDRALEALRRFGGTVVRASLSREAEMEIQEALHGSPIAA
jgi:uncharacterized membrane protein